MAKIVPLAFVAALALQFGGYPSASTAAIAPHRYATNETRYDPYKNYRFSLVVDGRPVASFTRSTFGTFLAHKSPGRNTYESITLERGLTQDASFSQWAAGSAAGSPNASPRSCTLTVYDGGGIPVRTYRTAACWISEYRSLPMLGANANAIAIQHIKLESEGWIRIR